MKIRVFAPLMGLVPLGALAQESTRSWDEHKKRIKACEVFAALASHLFGNSIHLSHASLACSDTDVSFPDNAGFTAAFALSLEVKIGNSQYQADRRGLGTWQRYLFALITFATLSVWAPSLAMAQDFTRIPASSMYQAAVIPGYPISEDADGLCARTAAQFNQAGATSTKWYEYGEAEYQVRPSLGQGCKYIITAHGGQGGYPEGYSWEGFRQNDVTWRPGCPSGYSSTRYYLPDGSGNSLQMCARGAFVSSKPCPSCAAGKSLGNPIYLESGAKSERVVDFYFGGIGIARSFRSGPRWASNTTPTEFGVGWYGYLTARIKLTRSTAYTPGVAYATRPDGTVVPFLQLANGTWTSDVDMTRHKLAERRGSSGEFVGWVLATTTGDKEFYDAKGALIVFERSGLLAFEVRRDVSGRVLALRDLYGREAKFFYSSRGLIERVLLPDGNDLIYIYDPQSRLTSAVHTGSSQSYEYIDLAGKSGAYLVKVIDETNDASAQFGYNADGLATSTQRAGAVDAFTLTYRNGGDVVDALFPSGRIETYQFELQRGSRLLRTSTVSCVSCDVSPESRADDANGFPSVHMDRRGTSTVYNYDARGQLIQQVEAANEL